MLSKIWTSATRKKHVEDNVHDLERVLTLQDLIFVGVGSALGLGAYVLAADIAKHNAGPAVCLSYVFGAISAAFSGLCYAELAARVPKAGSAYSFCYASVGECVAFIVGWNDTMGTILSTASIARGLSGYVDILCDRKIKTAMRNLLPIDSNFMSNYPDILAFVLITGMTGIFTLGVKVSAILFGTFSALNVIAIITAVIAGATKADFQNWNLSVDQIEPQYRRAAGSGGFFPFGIAGVMSGGTKCFFSYSGFDCPAVAGAEAKNPKRDIPLAMMISLILVFLIYFSIAAVLTLAIPYYSEDDEAPFAQLFDIYDWTSMKWVISVGAICALTSGIMGCIFYVPRVIYAMAKDGLIFKYFAKINKKTKTTIPAIVIPGLIAAPIAAFIDTSPLVDVMTLQGLIESVLMATCIIVLRYRTAERVDEKTEDKNSSIVSDKRALININDIINRNNNNRNTSEITYLIVKYSILLFVVFGASFSYTIMFAYDELPLSVFVPISVVNMVLMLIVLLVIFRQPQYKENLYFKVPLVPFIPALSILFNIYLCMQMSAIVAGLTIGWILVGLLFYIFYGMSHSEENPKLRIEYREN